MDLKQLRVVQKAYAKAKKQREKCYAEDISYSDLDTRQLDRFKNEYAKTVYVMGMLLDFVEAWDALAKGSIDKQSRDHVERTENLLKIRKALGDTK